MKTFLMFSHSPPGPEVNKQNSAQPRGYEVKLATPGDESNVPPLGQDAVGENRGPLG